MKKLKFALMILVCCVFAVSCSATKTESPSAEIQSADAQEQQTVLKAAVQNGLSDEALMGFECFADKVEAISEGKIKIEIENGDDIIDMLDQGFDIAIASNEEFARANGDYFIYSSPFYFTDYNHLTMTLNSQQFFSAMKNTNISLLNAMPLGAFYGGNYYIISSREEMYDTIDQFNDKLININGKQPLLEEVFDSLGADVKERELDYMLSNFGKNRNISAMECPIDMLEDITKREKISSFHICKSFHRAQINWIMLSEPARKKISEYELAVLNEAMAFAVAKNDNAVLANEEKSLETAEEMGGMITAPNYNEFFDCASNALQQSERYSGLWDWQLYNEVRRMAM